MTDYRELREAIEDRAIYAFAFICFCIFDLSPWFRPKSEWLLQYAGIYGYSTSFKDWQSRRRARAEMGEG